ncbi:MAG: c-type cytochrome, partial [Candidatus Omnitrophica bacterium]|nr:c-type cytochrome [Candidatus Omnitrophota bacterium]
MGQDERHYNINKLNFLFAIASLVLLSALGMVFLRDNDKEWRKYQTEFQTLEIEKTRVKKDAEEVKLASNGEYEELLAKLETAQAAFDQKCQFKELEKELAKLQAENEILNQQYKFSKAEMDAAKYRYETAQSHHAANLEQASTEFYALDEKTKTLNLQVEESNKKLFSKEKIIDSCGEELENLQKEKRQLVQKKNLLDRKLNKIDPQEMSFVNQMAQMVRNLPVIDLANPSLKIEQVVLQDVRDDVNFMTVPKVERCITCHLGISNPDYKDEAQPFKTHPNLELFVGNDSPHPLEEFGCTVCHGGRSRGIDFSRAAHTPASAVQKKAWIEKYDWEKLELWEEPMLPLVNVQAGCFKCHSGESTIKGADKLNLGLDVIERAGCYNCHVIDKYKDWPKTGPDLTQIASKLTPAWAYKWIADPQSFRHKTWMPSYFNQSNNSDPESKLRSQQEIHAIVHYLFAKSEAFTAEVNSLKGNPINGESLVNSVGCLACHQLKDEAQAQPETANSLRRRFGPILSGIGTKTTREWLIDWLKDPQRYHPQTRMPNLRLTDQEAADIASFLIADTNTNFASKTSPMIDDKVLNEIAFDFLKKNLPKEKATTELAAMN